MSHLRYRIPKHCAFCDNKPNSKEHAWPQWLLNRLSTPAHKIYGHVEGAKADIGPTQKALKVPCVCVECNTRWMHDLEEAVRPLVEPMLAGTPTRLDILQQWTVARWAAKTAMVFEFVTHERSLFYQDSDRGSFRASNTLPSFTHVWLARYMRGPSGLTFATYGVDGYAANPSSALVTPYFTTMVFGELVIQVVTVRPNEGETRSAVIHPKPGPWHLNSVRIWPTQRAVSWPPALALTDDTLSDFHRHFENPTAEDGGMTGDDVIVIPSG